MQRAIDAIPCTRCQAAMDPAQAQALTPVISLLRSDLLHIPRLRFFPRQASRLSLGLVKLMF